MLATPVKAREAGKKKKNVQTVINEIPIMNRSQTKSKCTQQQQQKERKNTTHNNFQKLEQEKRKKERQKGSETKQKGEEETHTQLRW